MDAVDISEGGDGGQSIGEHVSLTVTSTLQTSAGRLLFARIAREDHEAGDVRERPEEPPGDSAAADSPGAAETAEPTRIAPPQRGPFPPKPPNKRINPARNPRR